jgi:LEA14-like dessication related protein
MLRASDGRSIPIRKVRIRKVLNVVTIGKGARERYVMPSSNHHVEVFAKLDKQGKESAWESIVVSLMEAAERRRKGEPVIAREYPSSQALR